jgi:hypothetical protein
LRDVLAGFVKEIELVVIHIRQKHSAVGQLTYSDDRGEGLG